MSAFKIYTITADIKKPAIVSAGFNEFYLVLNLKTFEEATKPSRA